MRAVSSALHGRWDEAIAACVRGERHDLTLRLFEQQRGFGHAGRRPSVFAYNCAISACDKLKLFERSLSLAAEFRLAADADAGVVLGPPDRKT